MQPKNTETNRGEQGIALIITVILLLMVSAIGITALNHAADDDFMYRNSKRKTTTLAAAESGIAMVSSRLFGMQSVNSAVVNQITQQLTDPLEPIDEPQLIQDEYGFFTRIYTGTADSAVAQPLEQKESVVPSGYSLNIGDDRFRYRIYRASVVASDSGGGNVQIQAQYKVKEESTYQ